MRGKRLGAAFALGALLITGCATPGVAASAHLANAPVTSTAQGDVKGSRSEGVESYRSIPYAAAPVGARRFKAPVEHAAWKGVRSATAPGPACIQTSEYDPTENGAEVQSEDCLSLNVWTPRSDTKKRPVMVFIHGGAFGWGSTRNTFLDGAALAKRGDAVVVTVQYRLGLFGFTELSQKGRAFNGSGNAGMLDQIAALRWVKSNIAQFGGNQGKVTVFSESAGAESVRILLGTPQAKGLFQRAIIQSGINNLFEPAKADALERTGTLMQAAHVSSVAALQKVEPHKLAELGENAGVFSVPHLDGHAYVKNPTDVIASGQGANVPLMIGTNRDEIRYWTAMCAAKDDTSVSTPEVVKNVFGNAAMMKKYFGAKAAEVVAGYRRDYADEEEAVTTFIGDGNFRASSIRLAQQWRAPVYMYRFDYRSPVTGRNGKTYGATHSMELPFVFGTTSKKEVQAVTGPQKLAGALRERTMDAWVDFATSADPSTRALPWPRYDTRHRATMTLNVRSKVVNDPNAAQRKAWEKVPFSLLPYPLPFAV